MRLFITFLIVLITTTVNAQTIRIEREYRTDDLFFHDFFLLEENGKFYFQDIRGRGDLPFEIPEVQIGLYKYSGLKQFIIDEITIENIGKLCQELYTIETPRLPPNQEFDPYYTICFNYGTDDPKYFTFEAISNYELYKHIEGAYILKKLNMFFEGFYKEHGCPNGDYYHYTLQKGETLKTISDKLGIDYTFIEEANYVMFGGFYMGRAEDVMMGEKEKRDPKEGDKVLLPCVCTKQEKYEEVLPIR